MSSSKNLVVLIGNLGIDPEVKSVGEKSKVANFTLATSETYKDSNQEKQTSTQWHDVEAWANLAELAGKYLKKGSQVCVTGKIVYKNWEDKEGNKRKSTSIVAEEILFLDKRKES